MISGGKEFAFKFEQPDLPIGDLNAGTGGGGTTEPGSCDTAGLVTYPNLPQTDWQVTQATQTKVTKSSTMVWFTKQTGGLLLNQVATVAGLQYVTSNHY